MSKIAGRPPVLIAKRATMTPARKLRVWQAHLGRCEECGAQLPVEGPEVAYDHIIPLALGGADADDNLQPLCVVPCHARKTAHDFEAIARAKRRSGETGQNRRKRSIASPGFCTTLTRRMDGKTVPRRSRQQVQS